MKLDVDVQGGIDSNMHGANGSGVMCANAAEQPDISLNNLLLANSSSPIRCLSTGYALPPGR